MTKNLKDLATFQKSGISINVKSIGGIGTNIVTRWEKGPDGGAVFDFGQLPDDPKDFGINNLFITHSHMDHIQQLLTFLSWRERIAGVKEGVRIYAPVKTVSKISKMIESFYECDDSECPHQVIGLLPRDCDEDGIHPQEIYLNSNQKFRISSFSTEHRVNSIGFRIEKFVREIKPQYIECKPLEKKKLAMNGELYIHHWIDVIAITGDTTIKPFLQLENKWLYDVPILLTEMTFLDNSLSLEEIIERGHIHIEQLVNLPYKLNCENIIAYHFSARYKKIEIIQLVEKYFGENNNIILAHSLHQ